MTIGDKLRLARNNKRMSVKDIASQLKIAESTYRDWENGRKIQGEPYLEICRVLEVSLADLMGVESNWVKQLILDIETLDNQVKLIKKNVLSMI